MISDGEALKSQTRTEGGGSELITEVNEIKWKYHWINDYENQSNTVGETPME